MAHHDQLRLLEGLFIRDDELQAEVLDYASRYPFNVRATIYDLIEIEDAPTRQRAVSAQVLASQLFSFWERGFVEVRDITKVVLHNDANQDKFWSSGVTTRVAQMYRRVGPPETGFLLGVQDNGISEFWASQESSASRLLRFRGGDLEGLEMTLGDLVQRRSRTIRKDHPIYSHPQLYIPEGVEPVEQSDDEFDDLFAIEDSSPDLALVMVPAS